MVWHFDVVTTDGRHYETVRPMVEDPGLMHDLIENKVRVVGKEPEQQSIWTQLVSRIVSNPCHYCGIYVFHASNARRRWR